VEIVAVEPRLLVITTLPKGLMAPLDLIVIGVWETLVIRIPLP
jgi:hypothetical protein